MASKLGFRQHLMLLLVFDILVVLFMNTSTSSIFSKFIASGTGITWATGTLGAIILILFTGFVNVGVTQGSNFSGIPGVIAGVMKYVKSGSIVVSGGIMLVIVLDYVSLWKIVTNGSQFGLMNIISIFFFLPLIVDSLFASLDWVRGVQT